MTAYFNDDKYKKSLNTFQKVVSEHLEKLRDDEVMRLLLGSSDPNMTTGGSSNMGYRDPMSNSYHQSRKEKVLLIGGECHGDHAEVFKDSTTYQTYSRQPQTPPTPETIGEQEMEIVLNDDGTVGEREVPFMQKTVDIVMYVRCRYRAHGIDESFFRHEGLSEQEAIDLYMSGASHKQTTPQSGFYLCGIPITCRGIYSSFLEITGQRNVQKAIDMMGNGHPRDCHAEIHGQRVEIVECDIQQGGAETVLKIKFRDLSRY